jgi:hypothetical protein
MVFRREDEDRNRYFFVQYESGIPIYSFENKSWRVVNPESYFSSLKKKLYRKNKAIYDIVLTAPVPLADYMVTGVDHPRCISGKCGRSNSAESTKMIRRVGLKYAQLLMTGCTKFQSLLDHLPCLEGQKITLERPEEE